MSAGEPDPREQLAVVNLGEPGVTLGDLLDEAVSSLEHLDLYHHDHTGQEQFQTLDGRWFIVTFAAHLTEVDCPTCDFCADDVAPDQIGKTGPAGLLCKSCLAKNR